ncbi:DUF427 domain-containing protein [Phycicoccus sp. MAQZ13P-2]|uniref:DUF427 domain-containing protein n=1 Tax=Phycicoccus mangrovi TaxID=2840470 RepID=UPI001BFFFD43|nr:DUF427 domain-containing protein [Phycicoccus mangrovi]MBT9256549.1 DUF427 domain-containing protein [Phycicoccus mangrovi]MBT9275197.1 DUF427 domain-containing protein [Phycicoccus mangrovi]
MTRPVPLPTAPGQESVWDYPRPPAVEPSDEPVEVWFGGVLVARSTRTLRVLETSHPPTYYLPREDFTEGALRRAHGSSYCEWKGEAVYFDVLGRREVAESAAWTYPHPNPGFATLVDHVAVMPAAMDRCVVAGEVVTPQEGGFYGGWVTSRVVGPFKGGPGTWGW